MRLALVALMFLSCATVSPAPTPDNPCGLPNFSRVVTTGKTEVIRSAKPTPEQLSCLARYSKDKGGLSVFRLCRVSEGCEESVPGATVLDFAMPPFTDDVLSSARGPSREIVARIEAKLREIADAGGVILVHCVHGVDRTSFVSAMADVVVGGLSKTKAALKEMLEHYMRPFPGLLGAWGDWSPK
jgi:hypothetical protein